MKYLYIPKLSGDSAPKFLNPAIAETIDVSPDFSIVDVVNEIILHMLNNFDDVLSVERVYFWTNDMPFPPRRADIQVSFIVGNIQQVGVQRILEG